MVQILPTICVILIEISAIFVAFGWYKIRQRNIVAHRKLMLLGAIFAVAFFIIYVSRTLFIGNTVFGGPSNIKVYYTYFMIFHIFLASTGGVFGVITLIHAYKGRIILHKKIAPWTSIIWFGAAITGLVVYCTLYIIFPSGKTDNLINAILGM